MRYTIDKKEKPLYLQIYRQLRDDIVNKTYPYNMKLPSKRVMASDLGVSTITVEHSYMLLQDEGYIESRERSGYFVIFKDTDGFLKDNQKPNRNIHKKDSYYDFSIPILSKTMRKVLSDYPETLYTKTPAFGCDELKESIRKYLSRNRGITVSQEQIIIGSGSEFLYWMIIELLGRNIKVAIENPSYHKIEDVYKAQEIQYVKVPLSDDGIKIEDLYKTDVNVLHTTPYRSYPSGVTASASKRHEYINWSKKSEERYIIEDDYESEFNISSKPMDTLFSLSEYDNIIYINTFSRTISPALRVAYMVIPKSLQPRLEERLSCYSCTVPTFLQYTLRELIDNGDFQRHINRVRRALRKNDRP